MIRVILQGGLGNQMFEYAAAYATARRLNEPLVIDTSFFDVYNNREWCRPYELNIFRLNEQLTFVSGNQWEVKMLPKIAQWCRKHEKPNVGKYVFLPSELRLKEQVLFGYFPDYHLFESYREELLQAFIFRTPENVENRRIIREIERCESVAIHIRRGDYLIGNNADIFWHPTIEWYNQAIKIIEQTIPEPQYFIFSDDVIWAREQFGDMENALLVNINEGSESYNDLRLMSYCKHNIIANSSFSWWGAWLNTNPNKKVVAPAQYYIDEDSNTRYRESMLPQEWIRL